MDEYKITEQLIRTFWKVGFLVDIVRDTAFNGFNPEHYSALIIPFTSFGINGSKFIDFKNKTRNIQKKLRLYIWLFEEDYCQENEEYFQSIGADDILPFPLEPKTFERRINYPLEKIYVEISVDSCCHCNGKNIVT